MSPLLTFLCLCACTVLEDRESCPCTLRLVPASDVGRAYIAVEAEGGYGMSIGFVEFNACVSLEVPKAMLSVCVVTGAEPGPEDSDLWIIEEGEDCPELYMYRTEIDAQRETVTDTVRFHKRFCVMDISFSGRESRKFRSVAVRSETAGYGALGEPVAGSFCHSPSRLHNGSYRLRLPCQLSSDLYMEAELFSGKKIVFPLGLYLEGTGYDWDSEDLEDVQVHIDTRSSSVKIITSCWQKSLTFDLRI